MLESYAIGLSGIVLVAVTWVGVQSAWRKVFPGVGSDTDALAGRTGCHGCRERSASCDGATAEHRGRHCEKPTEEEVR